MNMPEAAGEWVALDRLEPWARNARQHSDDSTRKLAAGIRRFGFLVPLTAWREEHRIAAGHGRRLAMQAILREDPSFVPRNAPPGVRPGMVPVMWEDFTSEAQYEAFAIADNRQAKNAEDDGSMIAEVLSDLDAQGIEFDGMGFDDDELALLIQAMPDLDMDDLSDSTDHLVPESDYMILRMSIRKEDEQEVNEALASVQNEVTGKAEQLGTLFLRWWRAHG